MFIIIIIIIINILLKKGTCVFTLIKVYTAFFHSGVLAGVARQESGTGTA